MEETISEWPRFDKEKFRNDVKVKTVGSLKAIISATESLFLRNR